MSTVIKQEALEQFIEQAAIKIGHYVQAQAHLQQIPNLTREVFSLGFNADTAEVLQKGLDTVIHRVNSDFFTGKLKTDNTTQYCLTEYYDALHEQLDLAKAQRIIALVNNQVELKDIIANSLEKLNETKVKSTMRYVANSKAWGKNVISDLVYPILVQNGEAERFAEIKEKLNYLSKGDEVNFADLGFTFSLAQNGNLTIKIDKEVVKQLNELLKANTPETAVA